MTTVFIADQLAGGNVTRGAMQDLGLAKKPKGGSGQGASASKPGMTQEEADRLARNAAAKRKSEYQNTGRSSTILTSPLGLPGVGQGEGKTLLGT